MAYTQAQLDALDEAIANGALVVMYDGKRVEYRSIDELMRARRIVERGLNGSAARVTGWNPSYERGT
jgi:hypothetical protein